MDQHSTRAEGDPPNTSPPHPTPATTGLIYFGPSYGPLHCIPIRSPCGCLPTVTLTNRNISKAKFELAILQMQLIYEKIQATKARLRRTKNLSEQHQLTFNIPLRYQLRTLYSVLLQFKRYAKYYALYLDHVDHINS